jgi:hypothetical protein
VIAHWFEADRDLVSNVVDYCTRNANPARLGQLLQARRNVHAIAENVLSAGSILLDNDIAEVDADTHIDTVTDIETVVALRHAALQDDSAPHRINDASEFSQKAVAH